MRVGIAADHGGFALKEELRDQLSAAGHDVMDFGSYKLDTNDDFPVDEVEVRTRGASL